MEITHSMDERDRKKKRMGFIILAIVLLNVLVASIILASRL